MGSNDIDFESENRVEKVVEDMRELVELVKHTHPTSKIILGEILPRFYKDISESRSFERKRVKDNMKIKTVCEDFEIELTEHTNLSQIDFVDGIHLSQDSCIPQFVRNIKDKLNPILGVNSNTLKRTPRYNVNNQYRQDTSDKFNRQQRNHHRDDMERRPYGRAEILDHKNSRQYDNRQNESRNFYRNTYQNPPFNRPDEQYDYSDERNPLNYRRNDNIYGEITRNRGNETKFRQANENDGLNTLILQLLAKVNRVN